MVRSICLAISLMVAAACIAQTQPAPGGHIENVDGRPILTISGKTITSSYCDRFPWIGRMHIRNGQFADLGVDMFQLMTRGDTPDFYSTPFWTDDGVYQDESIRKDDWSLDHQATHILKHNPDARFAVSFFTAPPTPWTKKFPGHMQQGANGKIYRAASYASELWLDGQCKMVENLVRRSLKYDWGDRIGLYVVIPHTEGVTEAAVHGDAFDQSPIMQLVYRDYVKKKYETVEALRAAWHDESVTFASVTVPTIEQWNKDRAGWLNWTTPKQTQRYRDYFSLQRDLLHRYIERITKTVKESADRDMLVTVDALKQPMAGWMILDAFTAKADGMDFPDILLSNGSYDTADMLDIPTLDGLMTPADYTSRSMGHGFEGEGLTDSVVLRNKLMMLENDARSWAKKTSRNNLGAWRNVQEGRAGLLRNFATSASRGFMPHWANVGRGFFDHDDVMSLIDEVVKLRRRMMTAPLRHTEHAIAMIIDDSASIDTDFTSGFQQLAILQQRVNDLPMTGLPYRIYMLSDLERDDFPHFRAYLFPNLFRLTPERIELIRKKVLTRGSIAIFGPATGITDGQTLSAAPASELLGFPLELIEKKAARRVIVRAGTHPALANMPAPVTYGDSYQYGPMLLPPYELFKDRYLLKDEKTPEEIAKAQKTTTELGTASIYWERNTAGLVLNEFGKGVNGNGPNDAAVVFSTAMPMPASLLRSLALYAGCNPWSELGDVVFANADFVSVHSVRPGKRTIHLPRTTDVEDLFTGKIVAKNVNKLEIEIDAPQTRLFILHQPGK